MRVHSFLFIHKLSGEWGGIQTTIRNYWEISDPCLTSGSFIHPHINMTMALETSQRKYISIHMYCTSEILIPDVNKLF